MKHNYLEMIKAKIENMDLVLLVDNGENWVKSNRELPPHDDSGYFLCHPKHVNETIHWLNGGETQLYSDGRFFNMSGFNDNNWHPNHTFMDEDLEIRIKPKKEKRWIIVNTNDKLFCCDTGERVDACSGAYLDEKTANYIAAKCGGQPIEIEVEV